MSKKIEITKKFVAEVPDDLDIYDIEMAIDAMCLVKRGMKTALPNVYWIQDKLIEIRNIED